MARQRSGGDPAAQRFQTTFKSIVQKAAPLPDESPLEHPEAQKPAAAKPTHKGKNAPKR